MCLIFLVKSRMVVWSHAFEACCHKVGLGSSTPFSSSWASWWFIENFFPSNTTIWVHLISVRIRSPCFCLVDSKWPADSPSVSTQVWRRLLGQYHPRTRHSLAGLWGLARESWESVQQNVSLPHATERGQRGPVTLSCAASACFSVRHFPRKRGQDCQLQRLFFSFSIRLPVPPSMTSAHTGPLLCHSSDSRC